MDGCTRGCENAAPCVSPKSTTKLGGRHSGALKGEPLALETAAKTDENDSLLAPKRFFSSLVFATVATAFDQLGILLNPCSRF